MRRNLTRKIGSYVGRDVGVGVTGARPSNAWRSCGQRPEDHTALYHDRINEAI